MFWLSRPPYLRWLLAASVLTVGLILELTPERTVPHPFAVEPVSIGEMIDESVVVWRDVPADLLHPVSLPVTASRPIESGEPVLAGADPSRETETGIPEGWWALEVDVPLGARAGMSVKVVTSIGSTQGVLVDVRDGDFGERSGLIAVPGPSADMVAMAVADSTVAILVGG